MHISGSEQDQYYMFYRGKGVLSIVNNATKNHWERKAEMHLNTQHALR